MTKSERTPLSNGLISDKAGSIYGQMEVSLVDYSTVEIAIRRGAYSGLPDIKFSVEEGGLEEILDILKEAKKILDAYWLSRIAKPNLDEGEEIETRPHKEMTVKLK